MSMISILDTQTANSIAAGEVVERPASVVKECIENALDAGASVIQIDIRQGGISAIRITDNGSGMDATDALLCFARHATSKIRRLDDLDSLMTMGFRGEALASIAAVAKVRLETRQLGSENGTLIEIQAGELITNRSTGCPEGTRLTIENLFFNTPARFKFLKKDSSEAAAVADVVERIALARPDVSFRLVSQDNELLHTPGNNDLKSALFAVFGREAAHASLPVEHEQTPIRVSGFIGTPESARNSRARQCVYVNGRLVRSRAIGAALDEAFATHLMKHKFPLAILTVHVPTPLVDVNVHPQKMEVRFWDEQAVFRAVYHAVQNALAAGGQIIQADHRSPATLPATSTDPYPPALSNQVASSSQAAERSSAALNVLVQPVSSASPDAPVDQPSAGVSTSDDLKSAHADTPSRMRVEYLDTALELPRVGEGNDPILSTPIQAKTVQSLKDARLIGQLFQTYLLLEQGDDLLLIDQHAAHERILFEQLVSRHRLAGPRAVQPLLIPQSVDLSAREIALLHSEEAWITSLGFELESFGQQSVLIRSIPDSGRYELKPQAALRIILDTLQSDPIKSEAQISEIFYTMACKAAIKAHDLLHPQEIQQLLTDLLALDDPYHCPHGRPIIIRTSRYDLEKQFRRIV